MSKITERVFELARPVVEDEGSSLWDVEYLREAGTWYLRIYIDKEGTRKNIGIGVLLRANEGGFLSIGKSE